METNYYKQYSPALGREMECKLYGHAGRPVLYIPCQDGRFFDFENFHMADALAAWIESGVIMVCSIDTLDVETWSDKNGDPRYRICRHEQWIRYITDEVVPFFRQIANERNGWSGYPGIAVFGCSLGAAHAANLYFRRPDLFDVLLALSGIYTASFGFDTYMDDLVYQNSPIHYLSDLSADHHNIALYNLKKAIICTGQGPWELPDCTRELQSILTEKGIEAWFDYWGYDCSHDWYWWHRQAAYFIPFLFENQKS